MGGMRLVCLGCSAASNGSFTSVYFSTITISDSLKFISELRRDPGGRLILRKHYDLVMYG
ncbi:hypothetical protein PF005_g24561 [Phytophthora fragariae]|nr:hypothetical protein PF003_g15612 [Phytophthora fragariae]KAE8924437.1 hypothetical protein PF009_g25328 [Phytophthora fragariae]KAE8976912.1 hypothetical protein PF011_g23864 [Phytophthora fragariae]KAE9074712.1 hypothetical protein PF010_g24571 [Phytophthora fragariae]KAE9076613.1 hypothetical protein PF007_g24561 [Phytophthora fragariae]